ncbi:MAG: sigma-70 family RNA polymerase sigma factor [Nannocystaceae bacterium]|nr:sigma-70 family RNA polymerase sigma factor [Nannocystaceae bacterium]
MARRKVTRGAPPRIARSRRPRGSAAPKRTKRSRARAEGDSGDTTLGVYFREMSDLSVMTPEEELSSAVRISDLRTALWEQLLSYPPFIEGIMGVVGAELDEDDLSEADRLQLCTSSRALRDRETRAHRDAYETDRAVMARRLSRLDCDGIAADKVLADLSVLDDGGRGLLHLQVRPPRRGSRPFHDYVAEAVRRCMTLRHTKNRFVKSNLRLVVSIARRFNHGRMPLQDLIQEGNIGLLKAVDRFDHTRGFRFSTYGSWWIRHAISRAIADKGRAVRLPVHMIDAYHKVTKARRELEAKHGRDPTHEELATHTGLTAAKIEKMDTLVVDPPISLDRPLSEDDGRRVIDLLRDEESEQPGEQLEVEAIGEQVRDVITGLRPIEADILRKRFGLGSDSELTLKQIGEQYSLSRERIRQLQELALGKIRQELQRRDVF